MANHKSAIKRNIQNEKRRLRNRMVKSQVKTAIKKVQAVDPSGAEAADQLQVAQSLIDKASKKGVLHRRTAARKISRLARSFNRKAE